MNIRTIDIYETSGMEKPEGAVGTLTCYIQDTSPQVAEGRKSPAVLIIPGGGYNHTSERESEPVALRFISKGYHAFVLKYSCAPHRFPAALREAAASMQYIRKHAEEFGIDPDMVAALGFSAGAHLAGTLATMFDCPELEALLKGPKIRPDMLALCYPVAVSWGRTHEGSFENLTGGDKALRERLSLDRLVRPDMPPVFLWHTRDDQSVPVRNSLVLSVALEEQGIPFSMHIYRHGHHGLATADILTYPSMYLPDTSRDVPGWFETAIEFFEESGFRIHDIGGKNRG